MLVRAIKQGYHNGFRERGDVFEAPADLKSPWWVPADVQPEVNTGAPEPTSFSEMNAKVVKEDKAIIARRSQRS